ncbi:MAG TPA: NAD(P)/FAD-dependent oxidoreductase [Rhabdochlamydiaceae bacterium]|nr:NAD(P)/FAD-dependent oxidoreductase [Rhabdochlamydiaceae bacterium]
MAILFTGSVFAENKRPKVVVVGAGLAGLTTAYRLHQKGVDVHVYEARNRVGGRVFTAKIGENIAELGGQNVTDGGEAENIQRLIEELNLELTGNKVDLNHSYFTGEEFIPIQQLLASIKCDPEILKKQLDDLGQRSRNMREVLNGLFEEEDPLYKTMAVRLAAYEGAPIDKLSSCYTNSLYHMLLGGISAAHQGSGEETNHVHLVSLKGGNALLPEKMAQTLGDKLHLNKPLKKIAKADNSFLLTFQDDQKVQADVLVLAIPCSVYEAIVFEGDILPSERLEAIKNVQYGTNAKIMVPFHIPPLEGTAIINDRSANFFDADRSILTMYYTGEASVFTSDTIEHTYNQNRTMMEMGFKDACPPLILPVFAKDLSFALYEGPVGYSWPNDPYAKGSYSCIAPGQETVFTSLKEVRGEIVKTLFAPIDQKLYFAGEHASILMDFPGTMEGACESGERAARMILHTL